MKQTQVVKELRDGINTKSVDIVKAHQVKKGGTLAVVIPKSVREDLGIKAGDQLLVSSDKQKRLIFKKVSGSILD